MKSAFTLIELLVVMIILTIILSLIVPKGVRMLSNFQKYIQITKERQKLSKDKSISFIQSKEQNVKISDKYYHISSKGVITQYEISNDNR